MTDAVWTKSSHSGGGGNCVELATSEGWVLVRNSRWPEAGVLVLDPVAADCWLRGARDGEFDFGLLP
ncbi:DUF397 domain-containing protein [Kitasatospora sp. NPDC087315]|uniref:DUF397 domain-containing protein n=1 Tax=Kitasatospora sp. NPDC087315 TaxID=3364069 RepID=UPI003828F0E0